MTHIARAAPKEDSSFAGADVIFLDHQATTPLDPLVLEAMLPWLHGAHNAHSSEHRPGRAAADAVEEARASVAALVGCEAGELVFTSGATEASNLVLNGLVGPGDILVVSTMEHASVLAPADRLAKSGAIVRAVPVDADGLVDLDALATAMDGARLASIMLVNNEIGSIQPIGEIAALARDCDVPLHSDISQGVGRLPVSVHGSDLAYASLSSHKIYGPQGSGPSIYGVTRRYRAPWRRVADRSADCGLGRYLSPPALASVRQRGSLWIAATRTVPGRMS